MKTSHDDTLLRRTLQEIYADTPRPENSGWEDDVMREIGLMATQDKATEPRKRLRRGWWIIPSTAVAAVAVLLVTVTFWPRTDAPTTRSSKLAQQDSNKVRAVAPILLKGSETLLEGCETPAQTASAQTESAPTEKLVASVQNKPAEKTATTPKAKVSERAEAPSGSAGKASETPALTERTKAEEIPPYERLKRIKRVVTPKKNTLLLMASIREEGNGHSLANYDEIMGIEVGQPQPEATTEPVEETSIASVSRSMSAVLTSSLSPNLQSREAMLKEIYKKYDRNRY